VDASANSTHCVAARIEELFVAGELGCSTPERFLSASGQAPPSMENTRRLPPYFQFHFPHKLPDISNVERGKRFFDEHALPGAEVFVQISQHALMAICSVDQHVDCTQHLPAVADYRCRKWQEIDASPVRTLC
jgi:hypothetical protein